MAHKQWEYDEKVIKFGGKTPRECYKLIWQWVKEKRIPLSLFIELCEAVAHKGNTKQDLP